MALFGRDLSQLLERGGVSRAGGQEEETTVVLRVVEALEGNAKLALRHGQLCQLLPFQLTLREGGGGSGNGGGGRAK